MVFSSIKNQRKIVLGFIVIGLTGLATSKVNAATDSTIWNDTTASDLETIFIQNFEFNNLGQLAGWPYTNDYDADHATLWNGSVLIDHYSFFDASAVNADWILTKANDINDNGRIVENAVNNLTVTTHALVLSTESVDLDQEPETNAMFLGGLAFIGMMLRRRIDFINKDQEILSKPCPFCRGKISKITMICHNCGTGFLAEPESHLH